MSETESVVLKIVLKFPGCDYTELGSVNLVSELLLSKVQSAICMLYCHICCTIAQLKTASISIDVQSTEGAPLFEFTAICSRVVQGEDIRPAGSAANDGTSTLSEVSTTKNPRPHF